MFRLQHLGGYEEATEQESSSSGRFLLSGCKGLLGTKGGVGFTYNYNQIWISSTILQLRQE